MYVMLSLVRKSKSKYFFHHRGHRGKTEKIIKPFSTTEYTEYTEEVQKPRPFIFSDFFRVFRVFRGKSPLTLLFNILNRHRRSQAGYSQKVGF